jgi:hypothetical protein
MKKLLLAIIMSSLFSVQSFADNIDFNNADYQLHLAAGYAVNLTAYSILRESTEMSKTKCAMISTAGTILLSIAKESLLDSKFSGGRVKAAAIGAAGAVVVPFVFNF